MMHQLVNILEYIIPDAVDAEIQLHHWESQFDELTKQQIVLGVLNRVHPCYQLLTPQSQSYLSPQNHAPTPQSTSRGTISAINRATGRSHQRDRTEHYSETDHSVAVESMLPSHTLQQLQAAVAAEIAEHLSTILAH